jgi:hypothetical protein
MKTSTFPLNSPPQPSVPSAVVNEPHFPRGSHASERAITGSLPVTTPPNRPELRPRWSSQVPAAKAYWSKITETELQNTEGIESKLTALIEWRYALTPDKAALQVRRFLSQLNPSEPKP